MLGERLVFRIVSALGWWTIAAHAVVVLGGGLHALMLAGPVAMTLGLIVAARLRSSTEPVPAPLVDGRPTSGWLRGLATFLAVGIPGALLLGVDRTLWWWGLVACCGLAVAVLLAERGRSRGDVSPPSATITDRRGLWLLSGASGLFALVLHKPETDDGFFIALAARAVDQPSAPLLTTSPVLGMADMPIHLPVYKVHSLEMLAASVSWLLGLPAIAVFHLLLGPLVAALVPLAYAVLYRRLVPGRWLRATAMTLGFLVLFPGTAHGADAFTHPWIGNTVFLALIAPLLAAAALGTARAPTPGRFVRLSALQIAAVGATSTALWAAPVTVGLFGLAGLWRSRSPGRAAGLGLLSCAYPVAAGLVARRLLAAWQVEPFPTEVVGTPDLGAAGAASLGPPQAVAFAWFAVLGVWAWQRRGTARDVAVLVPAVFVLTLYNPYLTDFVARNLTSGIVFERVLWVLPLPVLAVLLVHGLLEAGRRSRRARGLVVAVVVVALASGTVWGGFARHGWGNLSILRFPPGLKVPHTEYEVAGRLHRLLDPGDRVLAVQWVSLWLPTFHDPPYPLASKQQYLAGLRQQGRDREFIQRVLSSAFVGGELHKLLPPPVPIPDMLTFFRDSLETLEPDAVSLSPSMADRREVRSVLQETGYRREDSVAGHDIWLRSGAGSPGDAQHPGPR